MGNSRWERIQALFHEALDRPAGERRAFVESRCGPDADLMSEVLAMLEQDASEGSWLDLGLGALAGRALDPPAASEPPRTLGPYALRERLGEGGMGVVYLAERVDLGSQVAIKFLRDAWVSPARRERFSQEQRTLAQLNHRCIARLYDADTLPDGTPWFAMEYVDGLPLTRYCDTHHAGIRERLQLFREVGEAVLHAHQHAVIHRDLKPSNILVTRGGQPKLLDFGIAKPIDATAGGDRTGTGLRLMTPAYAAPEQFQGAGLGVHTDIYALGAILYELLAGRTPLDLTDRGAAESERIVAERIPDRVTLAARAMAEADAGVRARVQEPGASWSDLEVLCATALQKDPDRRYRTVDSLLRDIDHYLRGEPLEARPDSIGYRTGKFVRRHRGAVLVAVVVTAVLVGLVAYYTTHLRDARDTALAETERTRRIQSFMTALLEGGDEDAGPADTLRVITLLERGAHDAGLFAHEPAIQAELFQTLSHSFMALGAFERADSLLSKALELRRRTLGVGHPEVSRTLVAMSTLRAYQSRYPEADSLARLALAQTGRRSMGSAAARARATVALGSALGGKGDYTQAIAVLGDAVRLEALAGTPLSERSATLTELANSHFYLGHYAVAESLNRHVLELDRGIHGARHPRVASDLINLGAIRQEAGEWAEAEQYYRQANAIYRGWYGENHFESAASLNMVGRALVQQGRLAEAREPLERALAVRETIHGPKSPSVASTLNELALLALNEKRYAAAMAYYERMLSIYRETYGGDHYLVGLALANLGSVHVGRQDDRAAERCFRAAIAKYQETLPADHLYTSVTRLKLGRALFRQARYAEAERETRAGYEAILRQPEPPLAWLQNGRRDLVREYEALGRPTDAARVHAELEQAIADSVRAASAR